MTIQSAEKLGAEYYYIGSERCKTLMDNVVVSIEQKVQSKKQRLQAESRTLLSEDNRITNELQKKGSISREDARANMINGLFNLCFLIIAASGEFLLAHWTFSNFGNDPHYTFIISAAFVALTLETMDLYLKLMRRKFPEYDSQILLSLVGLSVILILLVFLFGAEIRQQLYQMTAFLSIDSSLENQVAQADRFSGSSSVMVIMLTLGLATIIMSGLCYHLAKTLILNSAPILSLHRKQSGVRKRLMRILDELSELNTLVSDFIARFWLAYEKEGLKSATKSNGNKRDELIKNLFFALLLPITLVGVAFVLFFLLRSKAHAAEYQVYLDKSTSVKVADYTGKETEFTKNIHSIEMIIRNNISPGDSIKVIAVTEDSFSKPHILLDAVVIKENGQFGKNVARQKLALVEQWKSIELKPQAKGTDLFGSMNLASILFKPGEHDKNIILFSDMRNVSYGYNFEKIETFNTDALIRQVGKRGLIPQLPGVNVYCLGVHTAGVGPVYWAGLRGFWEQFFKKSNSKSFYFTIERRLP